jgi:hypothetical protein
MQRGAEVYPDNNRSKLANLSGQRWRTPFVFGLVADC